MKLRLIFVLGFLISFCIARGQVRISGTVFDISGKLPLEAVSVLSNSGKGTITDKDGRYSIVLNETDSIWFSYLNKPTLHYAVKHIPDKSNFEIALHVYPTVLKEVRFMPKNYRLDSIQNRQDYAKAFNFQKPGIGSSLNVGPSGGVGLDINELISMFQFRKTRRMMAFQERLLREEEEAYIDHRFSRALVIRLTQLRGDDLNRFMTRYRPDIDFTRNSTDYEFQQYIKLSFQNFQRLLKLEKDLGK